MNRRQAMKRLSVAAGALASLAGASTAFGRQQSRGKGDQYLACAEICAETAAFCSACFRHCSAQVAQGKKEQVRAMNFCLDCAEVCALAAKVVSRQSPLSALACEMCARACEECAAACTKHSEQKVMIECSNNCKACAQTCRDLAKVAGK